MKELRVNGPPRSVLDTRQCQGVSVRISDLAGGIHDRLRASPRLTASRIPAEIANRSLDYDNERRRDAAVDTRGFAAH
jgi:hypothetical protein